jgi:hypothetical protein
MVTTPCREIRAIIKNMGHNRKLVIGGVALVKARLKNDGSAMIAVGDEIEKILIDSQFFAQAPFQWISLIIRYGLQDKFDPDYRQISKRYRDLPISIEVDTHSLIGGDIESIKAVFRRATAVALLHVAHKYNLPTKTLEDYLSSLGRRED